MQNNHQIRRPLLQEPVEKSKSSNDGHSSRRRRSVVFHVLFYSSDNSLASRHLNIFLFATFLRKEQFRVCIILPSSYFSIAKCYFASLLLRLLPVWSSFRFCLFAICQKIKMTKLAFRLLIADASRTRLSYSTTALTCLSDLALRYWVHNASFTSQGGFMSGSSRRPRRIVVFSWSRRFERRNGFEMASGLQVSIFSIGVWTTWGPPSTTQSFELSTPHRAGIINICSTGSQRKT